MSNIGGIQQEQMSLQQRAVELGKHVQKNATRLLLTGTIAFSGVASSEAVSTQEALAQDPASAQPVETAQSLAERANNLVAKTSLSWLNHQQQDGRLIDPVLGPVPSYGAPMIGQAMLETGVASKNKDLITAGSNVLKAQTQTSNGKEYDFGFETFGLADSLIWMNQNQIAKADISPVQIAVNGFLKGRNNEQIGAEKYGGIERCLGDPTCWYNIKLVKALSEVELQRANIIPGAFTAPDGKNHATISANVSNLLAQAATNTSSLSTRQGAGFNFDNAGILSDPPKNPLAYNAFSSMLLGNIIESVGQDKAPTATKEAFSRTTKAMVGLMAPNGDVAYIGRGQGQVWNVAAATDALAIAAHETPNPEWKGRYLNGVSRALTRLETVYAPGEWGMPLVPRLAGSGPQNYEGLDSYANTVEYDGLALWALNNAKNVLGQTDSAPLEQIGADADGTFIDPTSTRFATVKKGDRWWAIHGSTTHNDARYDFGIVAAQRKTQAGWQPAIPYRPRTEQKTTGGPMIIDGKKTFVPVSRDISADAKGRVVVNGGWSERANGTPARDKNTRWVFDPIADGVALKFRAKRAEKYQFRVWYEAGSTVKRTKNFLDVTEPSGRHQRYSLNQPITVATDKETYDSAYDQNLNSSTITTTTKKGAQVVYRTQF